MTGRALRLLGPQVCVCVCGIVSRCASVCKRFEAGPLIIPAIVSSLFKTRLKAVSAFLFICVDVVLDRMFCELGMVKTIQY